MPCIVLLGTLDTKLKEILYLHAQIEEALLQRHDTSHELILIDCGREPSPDNDKISIKQQDLLRNFAPDDGRAKTLSTLPRGEVVQFMTECATNCIKSIWATGTEINPSLHGIISAGGSGGSSLAAAVMREAVPIGVPKLITSTVASGDTGTFIGETDITMMYSVVDIAGTNELLREVLNNSANAIVGMAGAYERRHDREKATRSTSSKTRVGITMFGVTTPCVDKIRDHLEAEYAVEVFVFHATGHGGKAMERLVVEGRLDAVLDVTTTEICDFLFGGNMSAGPSRLEAALEAGIPNVISLGATDMVNFGPKDTVPERYKNRKLFVHNSSVTLMRTTKEECRQIGEFIVDKIRKHAKCQDKVEIRLPNGGVSLLAIPGGAFEDSEADEELRSTIRRGLEATKVRIVEDDRAINDGAFAIEAAESLMGLILGKQRKDQANKLNG